MSLIAWYPLNGDSKNYGSRGSELNLTPTSTVYTNDGKIGKALYKGYVSLTQAQMESWIGNTISLSMWIYTRDDGTFSSGTPFFGYGGMTQPYNRKFTLFHYPSKNDLHCSWQHDKSNDVYWSCVHYGFFPSNKWVHLCIVQDASKEQITVYKDGVLLQTSSVPGLAEFEITKCYGANIRGNIDYQYINDIRIYDHALSKKEVREIYKTKLIDFDFEKMSEETGENILKNTSVFMGSLGAGVSENEAICPGVIQFKATSVGSTRLPIPLDILRANQVYRVSCMVEVPTGGKLTFSDWCDRGLSNVVERYLGNNRYFLACDCSRESYDSTYRFMDFNVSLAGNYKISNYQMRPVTTKVLDSSGLRRDGTCNGVELTTTTNRGSKSAYFVDSKISNIDINNFKNNLLVDDFTIEFWTYPTSSGTRIVYFGDYSTDGYVNFNVERTSTNTLRVYWNSNPDMYFDGVTIPENTWTHVSLTYNASNGEFSAYKNGSFVETKTKNKDTTFIKSRGIWRIGRDNRTDTVIYDGYLSDFKIYGTCLTANDISESYKTRIQISRDGSLFVNKVKETGTALTNTKAVVFDYKMNVNPNGISDIDAKNKFDGNIYEESDGSQWMKIFHHNNPAGTIFSSNDDFANSVYLDDNRWFNCEVCNHMNSWEFMIKQKTTTDAAEKKFRWIQFNNPMTASYANVPAANITKYYYTPDTDGILPPGYRGVEYIESSGTQYIDTGFAFKSDNAEIYADINVTSNASSQSLFGDEESSTAGGRYFSIIPHGSNGGYGLYIGAGAPAGSFSINLNTRNKIKITTTKGSSSNTFSVVVNGGTPITGSYSGSINSRDNLAAGSRVAAPDVGHVFIFANHNSNNGSTTAYAIQNVGGMRLYNFKIKEDGKYVRDFVPCVRTSDNVAGLYDLINGRFHTTPVGSFTASGNALYSSKYTDFSSGGIYSIKSSTYLCCNNGNEGNWWGAIGAYSRHAGGSPAWNGEVVTSGYTDLYVRIDNTIMKDNGTNFKSFNRGNVYAKNIIEY